MKFELERLMRMLLPSSLLTALLLAGCGSSAVGPTSSTAAFRKLLNNSSSVLELPAGRYVFDETLVLTNGNITLRAAPGAEVVFDGGVLLEGWEPSGISNVWKTSIAKVPDIGNMPRTLYYGETRLQRARGKGFIPLEEYESWTKPNTDTIEFSPGALRNYDDLKSAEIVVRTSAAWALNILPLLSVDETAGIAKTAPCNYSLGRIRHRPPPSDSMWVENVLAELDEPGEWVVHPHEGVLYYWPVDGDCPHDVIMPMVSEIIRVANSNVHFDGITFMHGDRVPPPDDIQGAGLQHGWDSYDVPNAMLRFRNAENGSVKNCRFAASGDNAIRLDLHAQNIQIENSLFENLGGAAVVFAGYGLGLKDENKNNVFANNHVHHVCQLKQDRPAVFIWQSGSNRIANNLIHDVPYVGVSVSCRAAITGAGEGWKSRRDEELTGSLDPSRSYEGWLTRERFWHGRDNVIESNELFLVMQFMDDGNAIYVSGTAGGNVVRRNYIHDTWTPNLGAAIRCDDDQHEARVEENLIVNNAGRACGIVNKGKNDIINNICVNLYQTAKHHFGMLAFLAYKPDGSRVERNLLVCSDPESILPLVAGKTRPHEGSEQIDLSLSTVRNNLCWAPTDSSWGSGIAGFQVADPRLQKDFTFAPGSPATEAGILPVSPEGKGVDRSRWEPSLADRSRIAEDAALTRARQEGETVRKENAVGAAVIDFGADG